MALVTPNRVSQKVNATGTGNLALAATGYPGFRTLSQAGVPDGASFPYTIEDGNNWECGIATYSAADNSIQRAPVASSAANNVAIAATINAVVSCTLLAETLANYALAADLQAQNTALRSLIAGVLPVPTGTFSAGAGAQNYAYAAANRGATLNANGLNAVTLPAAVAQAGWYAGIKKTDDFLPALISVPNNGTIDGLPAIYAYKESFFIYYDAAASQAANVPTFLTWGRRRGYIELGVGSFNNAAGITTSLAFGDTELRDMRLEFYNVVPSTSSNMNLSFLSNNAAVSLNGQYGQNSGTSTSPSNFTTNTYSMDGGVNSTKSGFVEIKNLNQPGNIIGSCRVEAEMNYNGFNRRATMHPQTLPLSSMTLVCSSGTANPANYQTRCYRP